jgi:hypothetical protein
VAKKYFIKTTEDGEEKGPYTPHQLKDSVAQDRIKESAIAIRRKKDGTEETTTVGKLIAEEALAEERDHRRKAEAAELEAKKPAAWRVIPLMLLAALGCYQSYRTYDDWRFMDAMSNISFSSSSQSRMPVATLAWVGVTCLALYGLFRIWAAHSKKPAR